MFACIPIELGFNIGCVGNSSVIIQQLSHMRGGGTIHPPRNVVAHPGVRRCALEQGEKKKEIVLVSFLFVC